jgi:hypothetical protein
MVHGLLPQGLEAINDQQHQPGNARHSHGNIDIGHSKFPGFNVFVRRSARERRQRGGEQSSVERQSSDEYQWAAESEF